MRGRTAIPLALLLLAPLGAAGAQIYYAPVSYQVSGSQAGNPEAKYTLADGRLEVKVSSDGVRAAKGSDLPYLHMRLAVRNKTGAVVSVSSADQKVQADAWGELQPEYASLKGARVQGPVQVEPRKHADIDLYYAMGGIADPAKAESFSLHWDLRLAGIDYNGETLFKQVELPYRYAYGVGPAYWDPWDWWAFDAFFVRPVGPFFFDPFFDPFFFRNRVVLVPFVDRDDLRFFRRAHVRDLDDLRRDRDDALRRPLPAPTHGTSRAGAAFPALPGVAPSSPPRTGAAFPALPGVAPSSPLRTSAAFPALRGVIPSRPIAPPLFAGPGAVGPGPRGPAFREGAVRAGSARR